MHSKEIIQYYMEELWNKKNLGVIDEFFTENTLIHSPLQLTHGKNAMLLIAERWLNAFPDLLCHWDDWISEENKVVAIWHAEGTHRGHFLDYSPSNKHIKYQGISIYQMDKSKIIEYRGMVDTHNLIRKIIATDIA